MSDKYDSSDLTPYVSNGSFHPISQESISTLKIPTITVKVYELDECEDVWLDCHHQCDYFPPPVGRRLGTLADHDPENDSDDEEHLLACCGEERPRWTKLNKLVVTPSFGEFVIMHDYLSTVHPWLMSFRKKIVRARGEMFGEYLTHAGGVLDLMVDHIGLNCINMHLRPDWIEEKAGPSYRPSTTPPPYQPLMVYRPHPEPAPGQAYPFPQCLYPDDPYTSGYSQA